MVAADETTELWRPQSYVVLLQPNLFENLIAIINLLDANSKIQTKNQNGNTIPYLNSFIKQVRQLSSILGIWFFQCKRILNGYPITKLLQISLLLVGYWRRYLQPHLPGPGGYVL